MIEMIEIKINEKTLRGRENCAACGDAVSQYWKLRTQRGDNPTVTRMVVCSRCVQEFKRIVEKIAV